MGIDTSYFNKSEKKNQKQAPVKSVNKNLCNVINTYFQDQSRHRSQKNLQKSSLNKTGTSAFMTNQNVVQPVSSHTLPTLSMSPSRISDTNNSDDSDTEIFSSETTSRVPVKFDTSMLSPCFDHIYKSQMSFNHLSPSPRSSTSLLPQQQTFNTTQYTILSSSQQRMFVSQARPHILKPSYSLLLKHVSEYNADQSKKLNSELMMDQYNEEEKDQQDRLKKQKVMEKLLRRHRPKVKKQTQQENNINYNKGNKGKILIF